MRRSRRRRTDREAGPGRTGAPGDRPWCRNTGCDAGPARYRRDCRFSKPPPFRRWLPGGSRLAWNDGPSPPACGEDAIAPAAVLDDSHVLEGAAPLANPACLKALVRLVLEID